MVAVVFGETVVQATRLSCDPDARDGFAVNLLVRVKKSDALVMRAPDPIPIAFSWNGVPYRGTFFFTGCVSGPDESDYTYATSNVIRQRTDR